jgi:hypothetical protein
VQTCVLQLLFKMEAHVSPIVFPSVRTLWKAAHIVMKMKTLNICPDVELVDPLYFSDGAVCCESSDMKMAPNSVLNAVFKVNPAWSTFEGALICRLRKKGTNSGQQPSAATTNVNENGSRHVRLLVGWKVKRFEGLRVYMLLLEHGEEFVWTEDKLAKQHKEFRGRLNVHNGALENTWLMEDGSVLKLALDSAGNRKYGISITISKVQQDSYASVPIWIEPKE